MNFIMCFLILNFITAAVIMGYENKKDTVNSVKEGYIEVTGGKVWYKIEGADKKGIPLLVLHGGPGAPHDYLEPLAKLSNERPVIFYDQLGCGNSDKPADTSLWSILRFVEELEIVRSTLDLEKVHILGQSWGTMLAADYILMKKPSGIVSLVFSGSCLSSKRFVSDARSYLPELPEEMQKVIAECEAKGNFSKPEYQQAVMEFYRRHVCRLETWPDCMNRTFEKFGFSVYEKMWGPSEFTPTGKLKDYDRTEKLKNIKIPVLLTCGRYDEASPAATEYYSGLIPGSRFYIFEDASHEHHLEKTEEYLKVVGEFIKSVESD